MHEGSCHCGAVRMTLPSTPEVATDCNCSLCRRIGGPWVYFEFGTVKIEGDPAARAEYIQGDRTMRTMHCKTCGCGDSMARRRGRLSTNEMTKGSEATQGKSGGSAGPRAYLVVFDFPQGIS